MLTVLVLVALVASVVGKEGSIKGPPEENVSSVPDARFLMAHGDHHSCSFAPFEKPEPMCTSVPYTHAHNDYEHPNPLFDALSYGFRSGEADIFHYENDDGNLRVAHDPVDDPTTLHTIEELYLDPLVDQYHYHDNGGIYADGTRFHLLIDLKTEGESTYSRLHEVLESYAMEHTGLITTFYKIGTNEWDVSHGAIDMTISGNRPREMMMNQEVRYATYDGRIGDLGSDVSSDFIWLLSDNWNRFFGEYGWDGEGEMPDDIKTAIKENVDTVHAAGRVIRFWNLPRDDSNVWGPLVDAGVDFVNTDRLGPLSSFIQSSLHHCSDSPFGKPTPMCTSVPFTHAHNDYEHPNPFFDALSFGFRSGEADIFLYENDGGNLRVAHDPVDDPSVLPTLEALYLDPLTAQFHYHDNGGIYADGTTFHLLIDLKTGGDTYPRLHEVLEEYALDHPGLITTYHKEGMNEWTVTPGAVDMTISGDRPREYMLAQETRYATYDGRIGDIGSDASSDFIKLLSDNWNRFFGDFGWDGSGEMPAEIKASIKEYTDTVHGEGRWLRFWNLPSDDENVWGPLVEAGVDFVNTDRLEELSTFIQEHYAE